jgi:SAM-dependent methyltransferase
MTSPAQMYEEFFVPAIFAPLSRLVLAAAAPAAGERVLDLACGTGIVARQVAPLVGERGSMVGLDLRPGMVAMARSLPAPAGAAVRWVEGDATALDFPDGSFELVICQQGLQFFGDRAAALRGIRRVLVDGGRAVIACWREVAPDSPMRGIAEAEVRHLGEFGVTMEDAMKPFSLGDAGELRRLLADAGFTQVELEEHLIEARFPDPDRFIENVESAYAAVMPHFAADPAKFRDFVAKITAETRYLVRQATRDGFVVSPSRTHIAIAR